MVRRLKILVTAGPTREYIDPVRYLSNDSSGQMGFAIARAAAHLGHSATLIAGPVSLATPEGVRRIDVVTAREMRAAAVKLAKDADVIIMSAAVADYRPAKMAAQKIKRAGVQGMSIELVANPDILAELGRKRRPHQTIVGFALETRDLERNALKKLKEKNCDFIVGNSSKAIGAKSSRAILFGRNGERIPLPQMPKEDLAVLILSHILCN